MPTSIPNINFLALLIWEYWRGSQNKKWALMIPRCPLVDKFLYGTLLYVYAYWHPNIQE